MNTQPHSPLAAGQLSADPRIAEARRLLAESLAAHAGALCGHSACESGAQNKLRRTAQTFRRAAGGKPLLSVPRTGLGNGPFVELADGSVKMDMICGIGVHHFGHSHPRPGFGGARCGPARYRDAGKPPAKWRIRDAGRRTVPTRRPGSSIAHCFFTSTVRDGQRKCPQARLPQTSRRHAHPGLRARLRRANPGAGQHHG